MYALDSIANPSTARLPLPMQTFNASNLMAIAKLLAVASQVPGSPKEGREWKKPFPAQQLEQLKRFMGIIEGDCFAFDLKATAATVGRVQTALEEPDCSPEMLRHHMAELEGRLRDELGLTLVLSFPRADEKLLTDPLSLFGKLVAERFPSAIRDMEEAARCLGFERATGSVFHQLRVLEVALRALHKSIGAPDPAKSTRSWATYLKSLRDTIDSKRSALGDMLPYYERAHVALLSIDKAWRNPTMHVESIYSIEEASDIASHVTTFLRFVASRIDENGRTHSLEQVKESQDDSFPLGTVYDPTTQSTPLGGS